MLQFTLCGTLCSDVQFSFQGFRCDRKKDDVEMIIQDISKILSINQTYIHSHLLNKIVQFTSSEYGLIGKPSEHDFTIKFAYTNHVIRDIEKRCFEDTDLHEDIYLKRPFIDNHYHSKYPMIKRMISIPIVSSNKLVAVIILCNKIQPYTKKDIINIRTILNHFNYLFLNNCFKYPISSESLSSTSIL